MKRLLVLVALVFASRAQSATYYVNCGASNDQGAGTSPATAWKTINRVNIGSFGPGDSVLFNRGCTWREQLTVPSSGSTGKPITFGAYGTGAAPRILGSINKDLTTDWLKESGLWYTTVSATPNIVWRDGVAMTKVTNKTDIGTQVTAWWWDSANKRVYVYGGASAPTTGGHTFEIAQRSHCVYVGNKGYITVDGFDCGYTNQEGILFDTGSNYGTATNCTVSQTYWGGIVFAKNIGGTVTYNTVSYSGYSTDESTARNAGIVHMNNTVVSANALIAHNSVYRPNRSCILAYDHGSSGTTIEYNVIFDPGRDTTHAYGIQIYNDPSDLVNALRNITIRYNYVHDCGHANIAMLELLDGIRIYGNVLANGGNSGGYAEGWQGNITGESNNARATGTNIVIYSNTLYQTANDTANRCNIRIPSTYSMEGARIENNIFYNGGTGTGAYTYRADHTHITPPTLDYNVHYTPLSGNLMKVEGTDYTWSGRPPQVETHGINADPKLTNVGSSDFTLLAASPCIDAGANLGTPYNIALMPGASWPNNVLTGNQNATGQGWEIGAYLYTAPSPTPTPRMTPTPTPTATPVPPQPPRSLHASFTFSPEKPTQNQQIQFTDTSTGASTWEWDFGDGDRSTYQNPVHTYATRGTYTVVLWAGDGSNWSKAATTITMGARVRKHLFMRPTSLGQPFPGR